MKSCQKLRHREAAGTEIALFLVTIKGQLPLNRTLCATLCLLAGLFEVGQALARPAKVGKAAAANLSRPLREISVLSGTSPEPAGKGEEREKAKARRKRSAKVSDPVAQRSFAGKKTYLGKGLLSIPPPNRNFEGVANLDGLNQPDTAGDVGPNHYVQWVKNHFQIFDKNGVSLYGPARGNTLWSGFGGGCETGNNNDPIVLYDSIADRWFFSQFVTASPFGQCIAVSTSPDPTGTYYRYFFPLILTYDYPKFAVWPDGYYMTGDGYDPNQAFAYVGTAALVFERSKMLAGLPASFQKFEVSGFEYLPADLDGARLPPAGSPAYFMHQSASSLDIFRFHVDWTTPANSTFTGPTSLAVAPYNVLCPATSNCVPQPGTVQRLDGLGFFPMQRFTYRNFGDHESLVVNLSVDVSSTAPIHAGVRWYEVRNTPPGGGTTLYQQGTYAPDSAHRWMGSAAMDAVGDIALGYSISDGSSIFPGARYTGRLAGDPLGTMPQGEATMVIGTGSQTATNRWGDYSTMSVDPTDDCTFWYTTEYIQSAGGPWRTRIASFKFPSCSACVPPAPPAISGAAVACAGSSATLTATTRYSAYQWYHGAAPIPGATSQTYSIPSAAAGDQGTYYVTGTLVGCASQQSNAFTLTVQTPPSAPAAGNNGPMCAGGTLQLTASGPAGATYSWTGPGGFVSSSQNPTIASVPASASGVYSVFVTANGCVSPSASTAVVIRALPSAVISAAAAMCPGSSGNSASVPSAGAGAIYAWSISNGTITSGGDTRAVTFLAGPSGSVSLGVTVTDLNGCAATGSAIVPIRSGAGCGANFFTVPGCRVIDTRAATGPYGGPPLQAGASRTFVISSRCGIPSTARAVAVNLTAANATAIGDLRIYASDVVPSVFSSINFRPVQARANSAVLTLGPAGDVVIVCDMPDGSVDLVLDVQGYFE